MPDSSPSSRPPTYHYRAFGFSIASGFELPELGMASEPANEEPTLLIERGEVPGCLREGRRVSSRCTAAGSDALIEIWGVGRYLVSDGRQIIVEPADRANESRLRASLAGLVLGVACLQRGRLPIHASAVELRGGCVAFAGRHTIGKSSLAGAFHGLGFRVVADDACVVDLDASGNPVVWPGPPRIKVNGDVLDALGHDASQVPFDPEGGKYSLPCIPGCAETPLALKAIYVLQPPGTDGSGPIVRLGATDALRAVTANAHGVGLQRDIGGVEQFFTKAAALARHCWVCSVQLKASLAELPAEAERLRGHASFLLATER